MQNVYFFSFIMPYLSFSFFHSSSAASCDTHKERALGHDYCKSARVQECVYAFWGNARSQ